MLLSVNREEFDLTRPDQMEEVVSETRPDVVISTAAYNAVDRCETERDVSWNANAVAPKMLAKICSRHQCRLVHFSTDYVFDGEKRTPYTESDSPAPVNYYARGKLAGEEAVLAADGAHLVMRTSWLFGQNVDHPKTFVHTILRQGVLGRAMKSTTDQNSVPTYVPDLAGWTVSLIEKGAHGLLHAVNDDPVSRIVWARAIVKEAEVAGLIEEAPFIEPVTTDYFTPGMARAEYTALDNSSMARILGVRPGSWRFGLAKMMREPETRDFVDGVLNGN